MSRPQTLPFQGAVRFKAVFARFRLPPQSLKTHLPISLPPSGSCFPLSFFFVKSGLPHWGALCASQIHLTCHLNQPLLFYGPLPPISHHAPLSAFPSLHLLQLLGPCPGCLLRMEPFPVSHDSSQKLAESSMPEWLEVIGELKGSRCQSYAQLLLAVAAQDPWIQLCGFLWSFPTMIASVFP